MPQVFAKQNPNEIIWKDKDGNLIPITKLNQEQLTNAIHTSEKQIEKYKELKEKFDKLLFELKKEGIRRVKQQEKLQKEKL